MPILDLGCGKNKKSGAIGIDSNPDSDADIIHDLNQFPYPFKVNEFDSIICDNILEHLDNIVKVMEELHRISRPGGYINIWVPYFTSCDVFTDPTHKHFFTARSFDYWTGQFPEFSFYTKVKFRKIKTEISFCRIYKLGGLELQKYLGIKSFANYCTTVYERFFAYIFPAQTIYFKLKVVK